MLELCVAVLLNALLNHFAQPLAPVGSVCDLIHDTNVGCAWPSVSYAHFPCHTAVVWCSTVAAVTWPASLPKALRKRTVIMLVFILYL